MLCKYICVFWASFACQTCAYKMKAEREKQIYDYAYVLPRAWDGTQDGAVVFFHDQPDGKCYSRVRNGLPFTHTKERKPGECHDFCKPAWCSKAVYWQHTEKPSSVPFLSALLLWPPCGTCSSRPSQKLHWTRWRLYVNGCSSQLETTNPVAFWDNYKFTSLSTSVVSALWTAAGVIYRPGRSALQSPELQSLAKPPHFFLSLPAPCELFLVVWASGDCTEGSHG